VSLAVRFSAEAAAELDDAAAWYDGQRPGLGNAFIDAVAAATAALANWPRSGAPVVGLAADLEVR
jgi:ParE toxin of type II toxin-antitoxin system, parDE